MRRRQQLNTSHFSFPFLQILTVLSVKLFLSGDERQSSQSNSVASTPKAPSKRNTQYFSFFFFSPLNVDVELFVLFGIFCFFGTIWPYCVRDVNYPRHHAEVNYQGTIRHSHCKARCDIFFSYAHSVLFIILTSDNERFSKVIF